MVDISLSPLFCAAFNFAVPLLFFKGKRGGGNNQMLFIENQPCKQSSVFTTADTSDTIQQSLKEQLATALAECEKLRAAEIDAHARPVHLK